MWVDISELINDVGVGQYIDIQMLQDNADTGDFGVVEESTDSKLSLKNIYCTMVENVDDVVSSQDGSYISRVTLAWDMTWKVLQSELKMDVNLLLHTDPLIRLTLVIAC
jgi:hypothetical protein